MGKGREGKGRYAGHGMTYMKPLAGMDWDGLGRHDTHFAFIKICFFDFFGLIALITHLPLTTKRIRMRSECERN